MTTPGIVQTFRVFAHQAFIRLAQLYLEATTRDYAVLEGSDFIVKYTAKDKNMAPLVLEAAQQYYGQLQEKLGLGLSGKAKRLIVIYPDQVSLNKSLGGISDQRAVGVYWAGSIRLLSPQEWLDAASDSELQESFWRENPLTHELTHLLIDYRTSGNYTRWLTEGLAQYMEMEITGYTLPNPPVGQQKLGPLERIDSTFDDENKQLTAYWQSRLLIDYVVQEYGLGKMAELLGVLQQGQSTSGAFQAVYGFRPESLAEGRTILGQ